jgi:hypothetical protein
VKIGRKSIVFNSAKETPGEDPPIFILPGAAALHPGLQIRFCFRDSLILR